jgi:hypothetical protein
MQVNFYKKIETKIETKNLERRKFEIFKMTKNKR